MTIVSCIQAQSTRIYGGYYNEEKIQNCRANCNKYDWAIRIKQQSINNARDWVNKSDDELWRMIPGQELPRCIDVTLDRSSKNPTVLGCLRCGKKLLSFGGYPYNPDIKNKPWKLTCPSCQIVFPTNDFGKYYASGIDETGVFKPSKANRALLYNEAHPDPNDPLHKYGVDDGYGYVDSVGNKHRFIAYYVWKYWDYIYDGMGFLADAFLYTGEQQYAHKAAVVLDRIADLYPSMDWKPYFKLGFYHSDGGGGDGKIGGSIWETSVAQRFADCFDKIISGTVSDQSLYDFLAKQGTRYKLGVDKGNRELFIRNIDQGILRTTLNAVVEGKIRGNQGMHQMSVVKAALALNTQPETNKWLDWLFLPDGGALPGLMISRFDRDGLSDEGAPGYAFFFGVSMAEMGECIASFKAYTNHNIFQEYPQLKASFTAAWRMAVWGKAIPNLGDAGSTGLISSRPGDPKFIAKGYSIYKDPALALAAFRLNNNSAKGLAYQIFSKDPELLNREIQTIGEKAGPRKAGGELMSGFGLATTETGSGNNCFGLAMNYGRTIHHAHPDLLNFDLFGYNLWLAPDHGYPEYATRWPSNQEWTGTTLSHNLVLVNQKAQKEVWGGHTKIYKRSSGFNVIQADGKLAYPDIDEYNRTLMMIGGTNPVTDSNVYLIDIFRVKGGSDHLYSFHGPPGVLKTQGLQFGEPEKGTYAGENVAKGAWSQGQFPVGYSHLYNIRKGTKPSSQFIVDWQVEEGYRGALAKDNIHVRFHSLTAINDAALANGDPPQNKPGNPSSLQYLLLHKSGKDLETYFISVIEPYKQKPFIKTIRRVDDGNSGKIILEIIRVNGKTDYILFNDTESELLLAKKNIRLDGKIAFIQTKKQEVVKSILLNGGLLQFGKSLLQKAQPYSGKIITMSKGQQDGWIDVDTVLPVGTHLAGEMIVIKTRYERDATYQIEKIEKTSTGSRVYCGSINFIRDYKGEKTVVRSAKIPKDYSLGFIYDFDEGDSFEIANSQSFTAGKLKN